MHHMTLNHATTTTVSSSWPKLIICAAVLLGGLLGKASPPPTGVAPVISPAGGLAIDGDLLANSPGAGAGDWLLSTNSGAGGAILDASGVPVDPTRTFHFTDAYSSTA